LISHLDLRAESASLASTAGARFRISSGFGVAESGRWGGNRPATVQHVDAERNEQSGPDRCVSEEDWATAHPQRKVMLSSAGGLGIIDMALSVPSLTQKRTLGTWCLSAAYAGQAAEWRAINACMSSVAA
jgi:hypothetical protein